MKKAFLVLTAIFLLACSVSTAASTLPNEITAARKTLISTAAPTAAPTERVNIMRTVGSVNLRECAGIDGCNVIRVLADGTGLVTIGGYIDVDGGQWIEVRIIETSVSGFINTDYLEAIP